jgi:hypothetical protein
MYKKHRTRSKLNETQYIMPVREHQIHIRGLQLIFIHIIHSSGVAPPGRQRLDAFAYTPQLGSGCVCCVCSTLSWDVFMDYTHHLNWRTLDSATFGSLPCTTDSMAVNTRTRYNNVVRCPDRDNWPAAILDTTYVILLMSLQHTCSAH